MSNPIYADFHVHTRFSPCGHRHATLAAMVARARAKGLAALGFADHVTPAPVPGCGFYDGQQIEVLIEERSMVNAMHLPADLTVLVGVEADYTLAGADCLDAAMLGQVDHVICSASHFHLPAAPRPREDTPEAKAELMVRMAREMLRVLKPDGLILWYDFWLNPTNRQTRGIRPREVKALFPNCHFKFRRITLAPPIARRLAGWTWGACLLLEWLRLFNTHYLVAIQSQSEKTGADGTDGGQNMVIQPSGGESLL